MPKYASCRSGSSARARSSASLIRLPSRAAARRSVRSTRHCTRSPYDAPRKNQASARRGSRCVHASMASMTEVIRAWNSRVERTVHGVELDPPPEGGGAQQVARLPWGRAARARQRRLHGVEPGVEHRVVGASEEVGVGQGVGGRGPARGDRRGRDQDNEDAAGHGAVVRDPCFPACRSMASCTRRSSSAGYSRPLASHSLGNMLIVVNPGMVLISFT